MLSRMVSLMIMDAIVLKDMFNQLLNAVHAGDSDTVRRLIAEAREKGGEETFAGLFIMTDDEYECTLLAHAIAHEYPDIIKILVDEGAEFRHISASGPTGIKTIKRKLAELKPYLREKYYVTRIGVFGSRVRGDYREDSDLDVLIEYDGPLGLGFVELGDYLSEALGVKVDLANKRTLKEHIGQAILGEVEYV